MNILYINKAKFDESKGAERSSLNSAIGLKDLGHDVELLCVGDRRRSEYINAGGKELRQNISDGGHDLGVFPIMNAVNSLTEWLSNHDLSKYDVLHSHNSAAHIALGNITFDGLKIGTVRDYQWLCEGDAMCYTRGVNENDCTNLASKSLDCCDNLTSQIRCSRRLSKRSLAFLPLQSVRIAYQTKVQDRIKNSIERLDYVIPISDFFENILINETNITLSSTEKIYNSVIEENYQNKPLDDGVVLFVGSLKPQKGIIEAIRAYDIFRENYPDRDLVIAGDGTYRSRAEKLVETLGLEGNVSFLGHVNRKKVIELYGKASLVVYPSIWPEPFGRISIESMASRTPIVGSKYGAIPEVIGDWPGGAIDDPTNPHSFANTMKSMIESKISKNRLRMDRKYTHTEAARLHEELYKAASS